MPRSSTTLHVTVTVPEGAPVVTRVAVGVVPEIWPAVAEKEQLSVRPSRLLATAVMVEGSPGITVLGFAEQAMAGGVGL